MWKPLVIWVNISSSVGIVTLGFCEFKEVMISLLHKVHFVAYLQFIWTRDIVLRAAGA